MSEGDGGSAAAEIVSAVLLTGGRPERGRYRDGGSDPVPAMLSAPG
ncbi:hypothetical protein [Nocardia neocaledoniensis]|nr:hypothetical protein [Nocardia neocaledoniensis]